jgi:uncharacterized protein with FMN-binding domain
MNPNKNTSIARTIVVVAIILIGGGALTYSLIGTKTSATPVVVVTPTPSPVTPPAQTQPIAVATTPTPAPQPQTPSRTSVYKDGTYSATGSYLTPGGTEKIDVSVTLKNDVVTSANVTPRPISSTARVFQANFAQGFKPLVVGKKISDIQLSQVSGSSLTSAGFNDALVQIETHAKV